MSENIQTSSVIPGLRYRDAHAAIEWLCRVFGFEKHAVYEGPNDTIAHAELKLGGGMIMLGSGSDNAYDRLVKRPDEVGGFVTQGAYLVVANPDEIYERVKAAGVEIVLPIEDKHYGGRDFTCRDLEGHLWSVGSYNPWAAK
jgi:uncharacterized glyoxalase superfamily protein PhnB